MSITHVYFAIVLMHFLENSRLLQHMLRHASFILILVLLGVSASPFASQHAHADFHTDVSDTISNSAPGVGANHIIAWTSATSVGGGLTIKLQFDPLGDLFDLTSVVPADISVTGMAIVANFASCSGAFFEVYPTIDNSAPDESITLTVCPGDTVGAGAISVTIGNAHILNPATPGSYSVTIAGSQVDNAMTRVAIINSVVMSAKVETSLTFSIAGLGIGAAINGATTSTSTTASTIPLGTLVPNTPVVAGQELTVVTNAVNGFVVTIREDQNLSSGGADIDTFKDGAETATPVVWAAPLTTIGNEDTYGHIGFTSNDADLNAGEFVGQKYAGDFLTAPRIIFSHNAAADGIAPNVGVTRVAYKIEIGNAQEARDDYANQIIYVCTPSF